MALQSWQQIVVVQRVLPRHHGIGFVGNRLQAAVGVLAGLDLLQAAHHMRLGPHLKELVQVRGHDAQVTQALEHRHFGAVRPVEHPFIERQNTQVSVQKIRIRPCRCVLRKYWGHDMHLKSFK